MITINRRQLVALGALGQLTCGVTLGGAAHAQAQLRQARIVLGFPAGSGGDLACRVFAERLKGKYADNVIVENKPGAAGRIGLEAVRGAPADGSSLLLTPTSVLTLYPHIYKSLSYDPFKDLVPVSRGVTVTFALVVGPMVPATVKDLPQFLAWCRANPGQASFGSPGEGSSPHFLGATLARSAGVPLNHVPYKGTSAALTDVVGGQVAAVMISPGNAAPFVKAGKLRILAVTSPKRWELLPQIPTMAEQGYPRVTNVEQFSFFMRAGTDQEIVERASSAIRAAAALPEVIKTLAELDMRAEGSRPQELAQTLRSDYAQWKEIVKTVGFTPQE
ncbi:MAG: twin-arginine translocation pathway signal protein [Polaromonas sp.]|uniref:tripartite tricarboxylate transporter substrate-binding protein n=1 Tax=Polaromonas sp. TaxID=1869339 RepID=UPI0025F4AFFA|nr:tripartite tricarboxylate transporter substrate-binding protein [Polaromonas sp.]MBI2725793.1 twin-arginine translocation pathway signal protein [Polaromonas sp.]